MKRLMCILTQSQRQPPFCFKRIGLSLLMGLIVLWPVAVPGAATGATTMQARLTTQVRRLWDRDVPFMLRRAGVIPQPPEYVAQQVLFALDRHDMTGVMRFVDRESPSVRQDIGNALQRWPADTLRQSGCWGRIGPYTQDVWFAALPEGSVRRIPLTLASPDETHELILLMRFDGRAWRIAGAHHQQQK
ncbi:hypothetical protein [Roseiflexus sp.]|uniref:hypothetical protein n=1 Tax=Roseiflexus sp. TaxID=2562120 RepID=UPI00398ABFAE